MDYKMAKFNIEVDSSNKSVKITKDGSEITPEGFSFSTYECTDMDGKEYYCTCISYSTEESDVVTANYSLHFDSGDLDAASEDKDQYGMAKEVKKIHQRVVAAAKLSKILSSKK
jgi:hypothetical protein